MGWMFSYSATEKKQIIEDCTQHESNIRCIKKSVNGNELWTIWEDKLGKKTIILFLLACRNGAWGYKDITEEMGPSYYKCPLSFLKEVPVVNQTWRNNVVGYHTSLNRAKKISKTIDVGSRVRLVNSKPSEFKVTCTNPLIGIADDGMRYKLIKSRIIEVLPGELTLKFSGD